MARPVVWKYYHDLGEQLSRELDPRMSFSEIGREIGMCKQGVRQIAMIALGKVAHQLRAQYNEARP
jgi:hypothetical protein